MRAPPLPLVDRQISPSGHHRKAQRAQKAACIRFTTFQQDAEDRRKPVLCLLDYHLHLSLSAGLPELMKMKMKKMRKRRFCSGHELCIDADLHLRILRRFKMYHLLTIRSCQVAAVFSFLLGASALQAA